MKIVLFLLMPFSFIILSFIDRNDEEILQSVNEIHKVYCYDTSLVSFDSYPEQGKPDTLFRLLTYKKHFQDGKWIIYYDKKFTTKAYELQLKNNEVEGTYIYWERNGLIRFEGLGSKSDTGYYKEYFPSGKMKKYYRYKNDSLINTITYYENGKIESKSYFNKGQQICTHYFVNGYLSDITYFKNSNYPPHLIGNARIKFDSTGIYLGTFKLIQDTLYNPKDSTAVVVEKESNIDSLK